MVEFEQSVAGTGGYIEVKPNHRYTVRITDADPFKLDVNITVSDWTDGGDFEYQPENELAIGTLTGVGATTIRVTIQPPSPRMRLNISVFLSPAIRKRNAVLSIQAPRGGSAEWLKTEITQLTPSEIGSRVYL